MLDGEDLQSILKKDIAKKIAVVPQTNEINFAFTVRDIVAMGRIPFQSMLAGESKEDKEIIDKAINQALEEANKKGIHGKECTPFLLAKVKDLTGGDSLAANIQLVLNNARLAARTAKALAD